MSANQYHFITVWRLKSTCQEIFDILSDAPDLARWWPSVYLDVHELNPGGDYGVGRVIDLYTKGWLPYTLRWQFRVTQVNKPYGMRLDASGDFVGRGIWTFEEDGEYVNAIYDWKIAATKPLLRQLSWLFKPVFSANHHWAMRMGEISLNLELARRHAATREERLLIPAPPQPTFAPRRAEIHQLTWE